ncbi:uncharacterized protein LOC141613422 [Silene latifolia]|uniref:uncharacterized protein LOC141613422 n=1 Tax=Silene latifolia TaxID=37657 RepID=UPI003D77E419
MKQFWKLTDAPRTVWTDWMHSYVIKDADIWSIQAHATCSPVWSRLLQLRDNLIQLVGVTAAKQLQGTWPSTVRMRKTYQLFRGLSPDLFWTKATKDSIIIPKHRFILTLAIHNCLATTDNLCKRGFHMVSRCALCLQAEESARHLFFLCSYSSRVLQEIFTWQGISRRHLSLNHEIRRLAERSGQTWRQKWAKCALAVVVYNLWSERNMRLFQEDYRTTEQLIYMIKNIVRIRVLANVHDQANEVDLLV